MRALSALYTSPIVYHYLHTCAYIYIYACITCVHECACMHTCVGFAEHVCVTITTVHAYKSYTHACTHISRTHVCRAISTLSLPVHACMHLCVCMCVCACIYIMPTLWGINQLVYVCVYIYMYIYTTFIFRSHLTRV